jgi:menaquinone-9 beta-reductase
VDEAEVAIVGGGPAGAALAIRLASAGVDVAIFERQPVPRWRAGGVYSSPLTRAGLRALGIPGSSLDALIQPIDAMEVISLRGPEVRLTHDQPFACGLDRVRLERCLLDRARAAGARVAEGAAVRELTPGGGGTRFKVGGSEGSRSWRAATVVGADGPSSTVARAFGVDRPTRRRRHAGITFHRVEPDPAVSGRPATARMFLGPGWYCGVAPVPGARVNIGIVMGEAMLRHGLTLGGGPTAVAADVLEQLPSSAHRWRDSLLSDQVCVALPLATRVSRPAGPGFLLVGDAAGFLDPLSGEGIHRALVSADIAAGAIIQARNGGPAAYEQYARRMHARFAAKDVLSWLLQLFLARPELADFALRRMATRDAISATFGGVLTDQLPASRALGPRFLAGLLRP